MNFQDRTPTGRVSPLTQPVGPTRPVKTRNRINSPGKLALLSGGAFLLGIVVTVVVGFLVFLSLGGDRQPLATSAQPASGAIVVQMDKTYLTQIIDRNVKTAGLPGTISNVQVSLVHQGPITITGDDQMSVLGFAVTKRFTLTLQLIVQDCKMQVHLLHADFSGIPVTTYAAQFETNINQQLQTNTTTDLPQGFTYCMTGVRTEPQGLFSTYSATPTK
jgi:hypothetical protein